MQEPTKTGTVALLIRFEKKTPVLVESISDDEEIHVLEEACARGEAEPLKWVEAYRKFRHDEDEAFGDYIESLLTQPVLQSEIRQHGLQWLQSKLKIEGFKQKEREATAVIAKYAYQLFTESPWRTDFVLAAPTSQVRVRIFVTEAKTKSENSSDAA